MRSLTYFYPFILVMFVTSFVHIIPYHLSAQASNSFSTYTSNNLGFTIQYPSDWEVQEYSIEGDDTQTVHIAPYNDPNDAIIIDVTPSYAPVSLDELAYRVNADNPDSLYYAMDLRIAQRDTNSSLGGHPAVRVVASYPVGQSQFGIVYQATMVSGNIYEVKLNAAASQMPVFGPIYEQMVNNFRIIKQ